MAQWRDFKASNEPGTCLWCGAKLRVFILDRVSAKDEPHAGETEQARKWREEAIANRQSPPRLGDYGDGVFCGLRCGYQFGEQMAKLGRRFMPAGEGE